MNEQQGQQGSFVEFSLLSDAVLSAADGRCEFSLAHDGELVRTISTELGS